MNDLENCTDETLLEFIITANENHDVKVLETIIPEALKRGLVIECKKCSCMLLQEDFDSHNCNIEELK